MKSIDKIMTSPNARLRGVKSGFFMGQSLSSLLVSLIRDHKHESKEVVINAMTSFLMDELNLPHLQAITIATKAYAIA